MMIRAKQARQRPSFVVIISTFDTLLRQDTNRTTCPRRDLPLSPLAAVDQGPLLLPNPRAALAKAVLRQRALHPEMLSHLPPAPEELQTVEKLFRSPAPSPSSTTIPPLGRIRRYPSGPSPNSETRRRSRTSMPRHARERG